MLDLFGNHIVGFLIIGSYCNFHLPTSCCLGWYVSSSVSSNAGFRLPAAALDLPPAGAKPALPSRSGEIEGNNSFYISMN